MAPIAAIAIVGGGPSGLALAAICEKKGLDYVVFERSKPDVVPRGGCLDLHPGSGQRAIKEAGAWDEFKKYARYGDATIHHLYDQGGEKVFSFGQGRDAPEIDRWQIQKTLLTAVPKEKIIWEKVLQDAVRGPDGKIVLSFTDGTQSSGHKLVVGADGLRSKIRPLVHSTEPKFAGVAYLTTKISPSNSYYSKVEEIGGVGSHIVMGNGVHMFNSRHADGSYRIDCGIPTTEEFTNSVADGALTNETAKEFLLSKERFGTFSPEMQDLIRRSEGPFYPWPMYFMPVECLSWKSQSDVTLIGDAAHVTTPYVGDGANCAMRDSVLLACALEEHGITLEAIEAYEKEMLPFGIDVIRRSNESQTMFYHKEGPYPFKAAMSGVDPLLGKMDHA